MDFYGPLVTTPGGYRYVLVFVDHFTKWVELVATKDQLATTVVRAFHDVVICRHGCPAKLLSDNAPNFRSSRVQALCDAFGVRKVFSTPYYPQGDAIAERFMRTLGDSLAVVAREAPREWDAFLQGIAWGYNITQHSTTQASPFFLQHGRVPRLWGEGEGSGGRHPGDAAEYARRLRNVISQAHRRAKRAVDAQWKVARARAATNPQFQPGDYVMLQLEPRERAAWPDPTRAPRFRGPLRIASWSTARGCGRLEGVHRLVNQHKVFRVDPAEDQPTAPIPAPPPRPLPLPQVPAAPGPVLARRTRPSEPRTAPPPP
ncbi:MAG: integrase catalytic domain-containing protein, partial [Giesbergeria sp.]